MQKNIPNWLVVLNSGSWGTFFLLFSAFYSIQIFHNKNDLCLKKEELAILCWNQMWNGCNLNSRAIEFLFLFWQIKTAFPVFIVLTFLKMKSLQPADTRQELSFTIKMIYNIVSLMRFIIKSITTEDISQELKFKTSVKKEAGTSKQ